MISTGGDGSGIPTATLREILRNDRFVSPGARLERRERETIALFLEGFDVAPEQLAARTGYGRDQVRAIQASDTYRGFSECLDNRGRELRLSDWQPPPSPDFVVGYAQARKMYAEHDGRKPKPTRYIK